MSKRWRELLWLCLALAAGALLAVMQVRGGVANVAAVLTTAAASPSALPVTTNPISPITTTATLDPFNITATHVVGQATAQAGTALTQRAETTQTLDPFELTATYIVGLATAMAPTPSPTPTPLPTPNDSQLAEMQAALLAELETAAGFSHPVFRELVNDYIYGNEQFRSNITTAYDYFRREIPMFLESTSIEFGNERYTAMIIKRSTPFSFQTMLLFRRTVSGRHILLPVPDNQNPYGAFVYTFDSFSSWNDNALYPLGFADRNANGLPDLTVEIATGGNGGYGGLLLFEITADGSIIDLTPYPDDTIVRRFTDVEEDGVLEIVAQRCIPHPFNDQCNYNYWSGVERYFGWDGEAYVDISATLDTDTYYPALNQFWDTFDETSTCILPSLEMYEMLVAAYIRGELDALAAVPALGWVFVNVVTR